MCVGGGGGRGGGGGVGRGEGVQIDSKRMIVLEILQYQFY